MNMAGITANFVKVCLKANSIRDGDTQWTLSIPEMGRGKAKGLTPGHLTTISLVLNGFI